MRGWRALLPLLLLLLPRAQGFSCDPKVVDHCQKDLFIGFEGKLTILQPVVHGTSTDITWKKEENIVYIWAGKGDSDGSLIIRNTSHSHAGIYTAEALVGNELQCTYYCLKVFENLSPPDLNCSVHNDGIQVNCTVPPQFTSQNVPVSYIWTDRGRSIHNESSIQLLRNTDYPEEITCIVYIANENASNSITLSSCIPEAQQANPRTRTALIVLIVLIVLIPPLGILLWKKGCFRKRQEHKGAAEGTPLESTQNCNESEDLLENLEEERSENAPRTQEQSFQERLALNGSKLGSDAAKNLEENEGSAEGGLLEETQYHNHSRCVSENMEGKKREDVLEDQDLSLKGEGLNGPKPDEDSAKNFEENEGRYFYK